MRNSITLNGISSNSINGLLIQSLPPITKPLMRTEIEQIDGRAGDIVTNLGFSSYNKEFTIGLYGDYDVDQVIAFFNSEGIVTFSNEPDKYYNYQIIDQIDFEKLIRFKTAKVTMHCQPFKYSTTETPIIVAGVNLISFDNFTQTLNGITINAQDGNISLSGTSSANTEIYMPINAVDLDPGDYELQALASGTNPEACSLRLIYNSPSSANSFGGTYITFVNNMDVNIESTLAEAKTYNYLYFYIPSGQTLDFRVAIDLTIDSISGSGDTIMLEGTAEALFSRFDLKGNTEQTGTPAPDNQVPVQVVTGNQSIKVTGKNLLNINAVYSSGTTRTQSGVTVTYNSDQSIMLNGVQTGNNIEFMGAANVYKLNIIPGKTYYAYIKVVGGSITTLGNIQLAYECRYDNGESVYFRSNSLTGNSQLIQLDTSGTEYLTRLRFYATNYPAFSNWQIQIGIYTESDTNFEPFLSQSYDVNLGKNLFDKDNIVNGIPQVTDGEIGQTTGAGRTSMFIPVTPDTKYTHSGHPHGWAVIAYYKKDKSFISRVGDVSTITTPSDCYFVRVSCNVSDLETCQFEKGSPATSYAPYFTPIELCKVGDYQDYFYKSGDNWWLHKEVGKYELTGTTAEGWYVSGHALKCNTLSTTLGYPDMSAGYKFTDGETIGLYCNLASETLAKNVTSVSGGVGKIGLAAVDTGGGNSSVYVSLANYTVATWKAFLENNPLICYYVLAAPIDTEVTNEALKAQLEAISQANSYGEMTYITALSSTGDLPHIMEVTAQASSDGSIVNEGNIVSKPKLTIYGSGDIAVYLNGNQLFSIALGDENYITIDTNLMEAYKDTPEMLKNRLVDGDYNNFALQPGENTITFSGSVDKCIVEDYSRWL